MSRLPPVAGAERLRARRWDALVLGSNIPALVTAARLGAAGQRVLVVEEDAARALHPALREPFFLAGARDGGVLDHCLRALNIPLIDQRRIASEPLAYQILSPKFRIDMGSPSITADELVAWGLCNASTASGLVRVLGEASEAERKAMLAAPLVRSGRRMGMPRSGVPGSHVRGLPGEAALPEGDCGPVLDAQAAALSNLASAEVAPEARARLLGLALSGGAGFADGPPWLHELLRRRVEAVYGEFRTLKGKFGLVPGITIAGTGELWVGRVLVVAAPPQRVAAALDNDERLDFLGQRAPSKRRHAVHLRIARDVVPAGMCPRLILMEDALRGGPDSRLISLTAFPNRENTEAVDLVARMRVGTGEDENAVEDEIENRIAELMPFSEGKIKRRDFRRPVWDDDDFLDDPGAGSGWPADTDLRLSGRPPIYRLDRSGVAGLGFEGDLLLGWRAGDAIAAELG